MPIRRPWLIIVPRAVCSSTHDFSWSGSCFQKQDEVKNLNLIWLSLSLRLIIFCSPFYFFHSRFHRRTVVVAAYVSWSSLWLSETLCSVSCPLLKFNSRWIRMLDVLLKMKRKQSWIMQWNRRKMETIIAIDGREKNAIQATDCWFDLCE
jgi:hypothetical protein